MRRMIIAGNWKMNMDATSGPALVRALRAQVATQPGMPGLEVVLCPPAVLLASAAAELEGSSIRLGAQNMHHENDGAFTGEISASMLLSVGCTHVILGHSERRQYFGETDAVINRKAHKALEAGLQPIICVGETLEQREAGITQQVIETQVRGVLAGIDAGAMRRVVIAYEPVWAIGTGRTATTEQAQEVHAAIRALLTGLHDADTADSVTIQYGGSMKPENALELMMQPDVDGGLVGGACLKADAFTQIIEAAMTAAGRKSAER